MDDWLQGHPPNLFHLLKEFKSQCGTGKDQMGFLWAMENHCIPVVHSVEFGSQHPCFVGSSHSRSLRLQGHKKLIVSQ